MAKLRFTADDGNIYSIDYDLPLVRDIRREIDVDLLTNTGLQRAAGNLIDFAEVLWHTCKLQAQRQGVDESEFVKSLHGCADKAADAWLEGIANFFDEIDRSALANLARAIITMDRHDREEQNELMTAETAGRLLRVQKRASSKHRRRALSEMLGDDKKDETPTAGVSSRS